MDEAAARLRLQIDSVPESLDEVSRRIKQLEIEREAIKRENDKGKLEQLNKEIADLKDEETKQKIHQIRKRGHPRRGTFRSLFLILFSHLPHLLS